VEDNLDAPVAEVVTETPAAPAVTPTETPTETPGEPKTRREVIAEAMGKPPTNRGKHAASQPREGGKFAPGKPGLAAVAPVSAQVAAPFEASEPVEIPLPKSLKKEYEPHWANTPAELRAAMVQREADYEKGISNYRTQAQEAAAVLDQFKPYEWILRNEGSTPQQAIGPLLQTAAILRTGTPAQKAQSVAQVMRQFGIPVEHVSQMLGGQPAEGQSNVADPQYNALAQQVQEMRSYIQQTQHQQSQSMQNRALSVIQQFAADPANSHFEAVQDRMLSLLQAPAVIGVTPDMSESEKLRIAYDAACNLDSSVRSQLAAQQQQAAVAAVQSKAAVQTARAAAVQVRGAPGSPIVAAVNPNNRRDVIANALRAAH